MSFQLSRSMALTSSILRPMMYTWITYAASKAVPPRTSRDTSILLSLQPTKPCLPTLCHHQRMSLQLLSLILLYCLLPEKAPHQVQPLSLNAMSLSRQPVPAKPQHLIVCSIQPLRHRSVPANGNDDSRMPLSPARSVRGNF